MSYAEKLKDPRWQRRRLEIMQAHDFKCQRCGWGTKTLHVHHVQYVDDLEPWDYPDRLLECLCEDCHAAEHRKAKSAVTRWDRILARLLTQPVLDHETLCLVRIAIDYRGLRQATSPGARAVLELIDWCERYPIRNLAVGSVLLVLHEKGHQAVLHRVLPMVSDLPRLSAADLVTDLATLLEIQ